MKYRLLLLLSSLFFLAGTRGEFKSENKNITGNYVYVPGGVVKGDTIKGFYISSIEVTNKQYHEFLNDLKAKGKNDWLLQAQVDTDKWKTIFPNNEAFAHYYFQNAAYNDYPVVNISKDAAFLYCEWLTTQYNSTAKAEKVHFVIPSEKQWILAARGGNPDAVYPWDGNSLVYEKPGKWHGQNIANYKVEPKPGMEVKNNAKADVTAPSRSYIPNAYGIYNMAGNVEEFINDKNATKGGGWNSKAESLKIEAIERYAAIPGPRPNIGLRPVMLTATGK